MADTGHPIKELHAGAAALQVLIEAVSDLGEAGLMAQPDTDDDTRDYRAMLSLVQAGLAENLSQPDSARREGFLRALTDLLCIVGDGAVPGPSWDPIASTARAFDAGAAHA